MDEKTINLARKKKDDKLQEIREEIEGCLASSKDFNKVLQLCISYHSHDITPPVYFLEVEYK